MVIKTSHVKFKIKSLINYYISVHQLTPTSISNIFYDAIFMLSFNRRGESISKVAVQCSLSFQVLI